MSGYFFFFVLVMSLLWPGLTMADAIPRRGLFVTLLQDPPVLASRQGIADLVDYAKKVHVRTLFVQVYRADQAWFPSRVGDQEPYNAALKAVGEDPFALLIKRAHEQSIEVHAWVNLLSLSKNVEAPLLIKYGPSILTRNIQKKRSLADYRIDDQYFLEPGDLRVRAELLNMVGELLRAYPALDGIQFDYIRYPDKDPHYGYTKMNVERFKAATGQSEVLDSSKVWKDWKRGQVTALLERLVKRVRLLRPKIKVSTTGCSPYVRALEEAFQDWPSWVNSGLVDFVTVMTYPPDVSELGKFIADAQVRVSDPGKLNIAVGAYQQANSPQGFYQQLQLCEKESQGACVIFHYGSLLGSPAFKDILSK